MTESTLPQEPQPPTNWIWPVLAGVGVVGLLILLTNSFPAALDGSNNIGRLIYLLASLALVGGSALAFLRYHPVFALKSLIIWLGVGVVLATSYGYIGNTPYFIERFGPPNTAASGTVTGAGEISFQKGHDGHFHVQALVEGRPVTFLVDTGASDIVLSLDDARRLGFDTSRLVFSQPAETANGTVYGAPVTLDRIEVGPIVMEDISAAVNEVDMSESLLGISFLSRLAGYEVSGDTLTLRR